MSYKLIALDMDGTLLNSQLQIDDCIIESIHKAKRQNKEIVIASGRSLSEMSAYLDALSDVRYLILESGAIVFDRQDNKVLFRQAFDKETAKTIQAIYNSKDVMVHVFTGGYSYVLDKHLENLSKYNMTKFKATFEKYSYRVNDMNQFIDEHINEIEKINFYHDNYDNVLDTLKHIEGLDITKVVLSNISVEMNASGVNKALGLDYLCKHLNIHTDDVIAVGDSGNDKEIFELVGLPIAMKNATDEIKNIAKVHVDDNNHYGVKEAIDKYFLD